MSAPVDNRGVRIAIFVRRHGRGKMEQIVAAFEAGETAAEVARRFGTSRQNAWLWQRLLIDSPPPRRCPEVVHALAGTKSPAVELVEVGEQVEQQLAAADATDAKALLPLLLLCALVAVGAIVVLC